MNKILYSRKSITIAGLLFFLTAILGILYIRYLNNREVEEQSEQALSIAKVAASALDGENLKKLRAVTEDTGTTVYKSIKKRLINIKHLYPNSRFAYLYTMRGDKIYFLADSEPADSKDYSPPGQEYVEADNAYKNTFISGSDSVTAPVSDRWGTWISILIPIKDETNGKTIAVFGMDYDSYNWSKFFVFHNAEYIITITTFILFLFLTLKVIAKNTNLKKEILERLSAEQASQRAEAALKESEQKYRGLVENSPDAIVIYADGKFVYVNKEFIHLMAATSEDELIGKPVIQIVHQDSIELVVERMRKVAVEGTVLPIAEEKLIRLDGSVVEVEIKAMSIWFEHILAVQLIVSDITDRKRAETELRKLSQAVQQSPVSVVITDINGTIEYVNPKTLETSGYSLEELIGNNPRIFSSGEKHKEEYKILWDTITSGKEWRGEFHNKKKNGELYWESELISPIIDEKGNLLHFLGVKEDVTEKKQLLQDLINSKEKAESANKLKDAFIANMSHEIRTPLNGILGMTSIIQEAYSQYAAAEEERFFTSIKRSSKRLINTVDKILNFSLMQIGDFPVKKADISLEAIIGGLVPEFNQLAAMKSLKIGFNTTIGGDTVFADSNAIKTALENLIDNAIKFTNTGSIDISIYRDKQSNICVDIRDTGTGISEEYLQGMFEPYSQEAIGYSRPYEGLGLGLAITKKLLDLNGASIAVKSKKGEGTSCTIRFDMHDMPEKKNKPEEIEIVHSSLPNKKTKNLKPAVLVVEDDIVNQYFIETILTKSFEVKIAGDAAKALELFTSNSFDLILMDISLKEGMNGLELTKVIRAGKKNPNIPIIAVTGHAFPEDYRNSMEAGCNDFLTKPFQSFQLIEKIEKIFVNG